MQDTLNVKMNEYLPLRDVVFNTLRQAFPISQAEINHFSSNTENIKKSIETYYQLFWRRIKLDFPGTSSLEHEGYLWKKGSGITKSWQRRYGIYVHLYLQSNSRWRWRCIYGDEQSKYGFQ